MKRVVAALCALALALAPAFAGTFQPGFRGKPVAPVALSGTVYQATASTFSPVSGAGGQAGDLMVVATYVWVQDGILASATPSTPSGWTAIASTGAGPGTNVTYAGLWYKYLDGSETASIGFWATVGGSVTTYIQALRFTGGKGSVSSALTGQQWASTNSSDSGTVASSGQAVSQLLLGLATRGGTTVSGTFTPTEDNVYSLGSPLNGKFYYKINNATATTVRMQSADSGNRQTISIAAALAL